jgi:hypothetical protein
MISVSIIILFLTRYRAVQLPALRVRTREDPLQKGYLQAIPHTSWALEALTHPVPDLLYAPLSLTEHWRIGRRA